MTTSRTPREHWERLEAEGCYEEADRYLQALAMFAKLDGVARPVSADSLGDTHDAGCELQTGYRFDGVACNCDLRRDSPGDTA